MRLSGRNGRKMDTICFQHGGTLRFKTPLSLDTEGGSSNHPSTPVRRTLEASTIKGSAVLSQERRSTDASHSFSSSLEANRYSTCQTSGSRYERSHPDPRTPDLSRASSWPARNQTKASSWRPLATVLVTATVTGPSAPATGSCLSSERSLFNRVTPYRKINEVAHTRELMRADNKTPSR